jgi:hypothetical protein
MYGTRVRVTHNSAAAPDTGRFLWRMENEIDESDDNDPAYTLRGILNLRSNSASEI